MKDPAHLITLFDLSSHEIESIFSITEDLKVKFEEGHRDELLPGRVLALLFEKPSLRTRVSFETAMLHLGGGSLFLGDDVGFGKRETVADFGRVLSAYVDVIVVRAKQHQTVVELARHSTCSVINGLTDEAHPCQALADLFTLRERFGSFTAGRLAWIGDGNNVARSLAIGCALVGMPFVAAMPPGYELDPQVIADIQSTLPQAQIAVTNDPREAVRESIAVYTDVWASMGQEEEKEQRQRDFADYQVNQTLMKQAPADAVFMHCLPARRGLEVTDQVIDGRQSIVVQQAANRLHVQKGILAWLLGTKGRSGR
ncbi:MAG: ornithine carbamoyltransferase [Planctomycetales bacterium]|nr:ornithine carbamoyltransferase [Planctomycetales bacterium]NIM08423.1 ornithine carbamoyltransferase [Planctomycetales bacterium]NIN07899.1 ornithine carbamoyltransferase [Planctomycetales bacterium]NIN77029.1 ornithine carbamoyltransferase [Planctomycetales bacterium]NIO34211.1 ornithine carbamoyltransferase [Planctomycetales bacterium]